MYLTLTPAQILQSCYEYKPEIAEDLGAVCCVVGAIARERQDRCILRLEWAETKRPFPDVHVYMSRVPGECVLLLTYTTQNNFEVLYLVFLYASQVAAIWDHPERHEQTLTSFE